MKMELICSSNESVITKVIQIQEQCKRNNIEVAVNQLKGQDVKTMQIDVRICCVLLLDDTFVDLLENSGRLVSKISKMISKPNKLIFMKHVADDKFQEIMEMFDPPYKNIVNTEEELIKFYYIKSPSESDEMAAVTTDIESIEHLSTSSFKKHPDITVSSEMFLRKATEPVESRHSFSSDDSRDGKCHMNEEQRQMKFGVQKSKSALNIPMGNSGHQRENQQGDIDRQSDRRQMKSLPNNIYSVATSQLHPTPQTESVMTSYVEAGMSHVPSLGINRPLQMSVQTFDSSGPSALHWQSRSGYDCQSTLLPSLQQHLANVPQCSTSKLKSMIGSDTGRPHVMNNVNFRPEILNLNRNYVPPYNPNIQSDGSDNRAISCGRCGHSVVSKQEQSDVGPSCETFHSAGGASGLTEKEYIKYNPDKVSVWELKEEVMVMIRDCLDCSDHYNWRKLADLHKWSFGRIYQLEQKWKNRKIDSPFMHLIEEFQHYTLLELKEDLQRIPRKDLLNKLEELQNKGLLFHA